jgi:CHAD domain
VRAVAGKMKVRPLFEVRTRRRVLSIEADGFPPGEIALDETTIRLGDDIEELHDMRVASRRLRAALSLSADAPCPPQPT